MQAGREIYWNVGHAVTLPMYLLSALALALLAWSVWRRLAIYRRGGPLARGDALRERLFAALRLVLSQQKVMTTGYGRVHALLFYSFVTLGLGTVLVFVQADITAPLWGWRFLNGWFYLGFSLVLDIAGALAALALTALALRRFVWRREEMSITAGDVLLYALLLGIIGSGFMLEAARMVAKGIIAQGNIAIFSPIGYLVTPLFSAQSAAAAADWHRGLWWLHLVLVLTFIASVAATRLRHLLTIPANYVAINRGFAATPTTIDLEDEKAEQFGAAVVSDLSWKDIFDADACVQCLRCQDNCPAFITGKPLSPLRLVSAVGTLAEENDDTPLLQLITTDALWSCTTCRSCEERCPATIEHVGKIIAMRRDCVLMKGEFPGDEVMTAAENIEINANPFGMAYAQRGDWAQGLDVSLLSDDAAVDIVYFAGCFASYDKRNIAVARAFIRLCNAAGIRVGILGKEEKCCGDAMRRLGNEYLYQMLAQENIATLQRYAVKHLVTTCPHCFNSLGRDYRASGLDITVEHATTFIDKLRQDGRLRLDSVAAQCSYHDSCYLGRYNGIYDQPRQLLQAVGMTVVEMEHHRADSFCCGAGGGRILAEEKLGSRISETRVQMALAQNTGLLVSSCPFCLTMFEDGVKGCDGEEQLRCVDLMELLAQRLDEQQEC